MSKHKKNNNNTKSDWDRMHEERLLEWLKNEKAGPYKYGGPTHSYNAIVYVRDPLTAMGLLLHLHTLGFWVHDMWIQPWNIDRMMHLENRVFSLYGDCISTGGVFREHGQYLTDDEIKERLDEHLDSLRGMIDRTPEEEMTYFDRDFKSKRVINCGSNVQMFKLVSEWDDNDFHGHLLVNMHDSERPRLQFPASNIDDINGYNGRVLKDGTVIDWFREATIDDIIEYFSGQGNWDHTDSFKETVNGEKRMIKFEDTI